MTVLYHYLLFRQTSPLRLACTEDKHKRASTPLVSVGRRQSGPVRNGQTSADWPQPTIQGRGGQTDAMSRSAQAERQAESQKLDSAACAKRLRR